jgi:hypothetical protein
MQAPRIHLVGGASALKGKQLLTDRLTRADIRLADSEF